MSLQQTFIKRAFTYLESGPVLLVTTNDGNRDNVMAISWQMVMDFTPKLAISTGSWNESFQTILEQKECCVCVPTVDMIEKVVKIGVVHGSECDKFETFGLTKQKGNGAPPLIEDCLACLECRLVDHIADHGLLIFEGTHLWENLGKEERRTFHANGDGTFYADGELYNYRETMRKWVPDGCVRL